MSKALLVRIAAAGAATAVIVLGTAACDPAKDSAKDSGSGAPAASSGTSTTAASAPAKKADAKPKAKPAFKGDGTFTVGSDIQPGTYKSSGNDDGMCYWEREKDAKGTDDSILANDNVTGSSYVTITKTDKFFKSTDCKDWYPVSADRGAAPKSTVSGDGMYKVGTDIVPGTYSSAGGDTCYWERTKDALHGLESIKANDNPTGKAVVTIAGTDAYFKSQGCDTWKKSG